MPQRLSAFGILIGLAASSVAAILVMAVGGIAVAMLSPAEFEWFGAPDSAAPGAAVVALFLIASLCGAFVAGYVTARYAVGDEWVNALAAGAAYAVLTVASFDEPVFRELPLWFPIAITGLSLPLSLLGGYFQRRDIVS
jgi:hypothetical protein